MQQQQQQQQRKWQWTNTNIQQIHSIAIPYFDCHSHFYRAIAEWLLLSIIYAYNLLAALNACDKFNGKNYARLCTAQLRFVRSFDIARYPHVCSFLPWIMINGIKTSARRGWRGAQKKNNNNITQHNTTIIGNHVEKNWKKRSWSKCIKLRAMFSYFE